MALDTIRRVAVAELLSAGKQDRKEGDVGGGAGISADVSLISDSPSVKYSALEVKSTHHAWAGIWDISRASKTETADSIMAEVKSEEKQARRSIILNMILAILALAFTVTFGIITYLSTSQLTTLTTNATQMSATALRNSDISLALSNLTSPTAANSYITSSQRKASLNEPALILPDVKGGYELTPHGTAVLNRANLWQDVMDEVARNPQLPTNEIILSLGVDRLYNDATNRELTVDKLIGTVATLIDKLHQK
jgi:hypothetical protein